MSRLGLERDIVDAQVRTASIEQLREHGVLLPTLSQLANPSTIPDEVAEALDEVDPDEAHPLNLFRVHWFNDTDRRTRVKVPNHVVLPRELTGVEAPIIVLYGNRFPMINAHKVLAAYGCLVPRLVTGQYNARTQRAIWPSTGNYCRGGVAISRVLGCRGVAVLPEGMSQERFDWLDAWVADPSDIVRTVGVESNVKEIYDACHRLDEDPANVIFNQFCEFANHLTHYKCTGAAAKAAYDYVAMNHKDMKLAAFVSATGSAGTIAAGDFLKDEYGARIVAAEALECPTMLYNGFGEHNIQGIGDKHIPLIHNVTNTDVAVAVSDRATDCLNLLFQSDVGRKHLRKDRGLPDELVDELRNFGLSSICNVLASIKTAKKLGLGPNDAIVTVATDGAAMYSSELDKAKAKYFAGQFEPHMAEEVFDHELVGADDDHVLVCDQRIKSRIFNLGYFTWVEQQGVSLEEFEARRSQDHWRALRELLPVWDEMIEAFNNETGVIVA
jgi:cysteine synthase